MVSKNTQKVFNPYNHSLAVEPSFQYTEDDITGNEIDKMEPRARLYDTIVFKEKGSRVLEDVIKSDSPQYQKKGSIMVRPCGYDTSCRECGIIQRGNTIIQKGDSVFILCPDCAVEIVEIAKNNLKKKKNQILYHDDSEFVVYDLDNPIKIRDIITGNVKKTSNPVVIHPDSKIEVNLHPDYKFAVDITDMEKLAEGILDFYKCDFLKTMTHNEKKCQMCLEKKRRTYIIGHEESKRIISTCPTCSSNIAHNMIKYVELNQPEIISTVI